MLSFNRLSAFAMAARLRAHRPDHLGVGPAAFVR